LTREPRSAPIVVLSALLITLISITAAITGGTELNILSITDQSADLGLSSKMSVAGTNRLVDGVPSSTNIAFSVVALAIANEYWVPIYAIFTVALLIIIVGYWMVLREDDKNKPVAKQKIAELRTATAILPEFARTELSGMVAESEALFGRKNYTRALRRAEAAMSEVSDVREVIDQTRASIAASQDKLHKARALGLEISEEAVGLAALTRELGVEK
jgi:hypothetical protein